MAGRTNERARDATPSWQTRSSSQRHSLAGVVYSCQEELGYPGEEAYVQWMSIGGRGRGRISSGIECSVDVVQGGMFS